MYASSGVESAVMEPPNESADEPSTSRRDARRAAYNTPAPVPVRAAAPPPARAGPPDPWLRTTVYLGAELRVLSVNEDTQQVPAHGWLNLFWEVPGGEEAARALCDMPYREAEEGARLPVHTRRLFLNAAASGVHETRLRHLTGAVVHLSVAFTATFQQAWSMERFPFDRQFVAAVVRVNVGAWRLAMTTEMSEDWVDGASMADWDRLQRFKAARPFRFAAGPGLRASGWVLCEGDRLDSMGEPRAALHLRPVADGRLGQPTLLVPVERDSSSYVTNVGLPLFIVVAMGALVFRVDSAPLVSDAGGERDDTDKLALDRINVLLPVVAALVIMRLVAVNLTPAWGGSRGGVLTLLDRYVALAFVLLGLVGVQVALIYSIDSRDLRLSVDRACAFGFLAFWFFFNAAIWAAAHGRRVWCLQGPLRSEWSGLKKRALDWQPREPCAANSDRSGNEGEVVDDSRAFLARQRNRLVRLAADPVLRRACAAVAGGDDCGGGGEVDLTRSAEFRTAHKLLDQVDTRAFQGLHTAYHNRDVFLLLYTLARHNNGRAVRRYNRAAKAALMSRSFVPRSSRDAVRAMLEEQYSFRQLCRYDRQAEALLDTALGVIEERVGDSRRRYDPEWLLLRARVLENRARLLRGSGRLEAAVADVRECMAVRELPSVLKLPGEAARASYPYVTLGKVRTDQGRHREAVEAFSRAVDIRARAHEGRFHRAVGAVLSDLAGARHALAEQVWKGGEEEEVQAAAADEEEEAAVCRRRRRRRSVTVARSLAHLQRVAALLEEALDTSSEALAVFRALAPQTDMHAAEVRQNRAIHHSLRVAREAAEAAARVESGGGEI